MRTALQQIVAAPLVVAEAEGRSVILPGTPIAVDGATLDEACEETVLALREYATNWAARLSAVPNHADQWALIQLAELSAHRELLDWLTAGTAHRCA